MVGLWLSAGELLGNSHYHDILSHWRATSDVHFSVSLRLMWCDWERTHKRFHWLAIYCIAILWHCFGNPNFGTELLDWLEPWWVVLRALEPRWHVQDFLGAAWWSSQMHKWVMNSVWRWWLVGWLVDWLLARSQLWVQPQSISIGLNDALCGHVPSSASQIASQ